MTGVDACNTVLEVLLFAAAMNLGQSWYTVLTLFGCMLAQKVSIRQTNLQSDFDVLHSDLGRISHKNSYAWPHLWSGRGHTDPVYCLRDHRGQRWRKLLATVNAADLWYRQA